MTTRRTVLLSLAMATFIHLPLQAEEAAAESPAIDPSEVFARQGEAVLTQTELDAEFAKIPSEYRLAYIRNGERVDQIVSTLLRYKLIAADARAHGFDEESLVQARMKLAAEKELAEAWILQVMEDAPEADYQALAHEFYLANPDAFMTAEYIDVTHILVSSEARGREEAMALADQLHSELVENPELFDEYVMEYSEDPSKGSNRGNFPRMQRGEMVKPFEDASFAMQTVGEISEPVETNYGFHIIRFNERFPPRLKKYEDVQAEAMEMARKRYLEEYRSRYVRKQIESPIDIPQSAVEAMVKRYFGENLELAPNFQE